ncbi:hypothetical protein MMG00_01250 [Ignatzschineria rhizosphaerae]|uniref:Uncharacterized protein n=1 Tax=Ignatzschineria rhizosphaerae TaxID=2923279 RepID=A0ABY3X0Z9_9GAMM|nr:hypothetical protein [Ignatzschineria rhizosphaerae]UNM96521.1 hypothetical protein MMG00_01250 [Ignatzschineria rhizosphaerae]
MRVIFLPLILLWVLFSLLSTLSSAQTIRFQIEELSKPDRYGYVDYYQDHVIRFQEGD